MIKNVFFSFPFLSDDVFQRRCTPWMYVIEDVLALIFGVVLVFVGYTLILKWKLKWRRWILLKQIEAN